MSKAAAVANTSLRSLFCKINKLDPQSANWLVRRVGPTDTLLASLLSQAIHFDELSALAARRAAMLADKGGSPIKLLSFRALVVGLQQAFKIATGRDAKVTYNDSANVYGGQFVEFVEAVLPIAQALTQHLGKPLQHPDGLGRYIYEQTRAGRKRPSLYSG